MPLGFSLCSSLCAHSYLELWKIPCLNGSQVGTEGIHMGRTHMGAPGRAPGGPEENPVGLRGGGRGQEAFREEGRPKVGFKLG